MNSKFGTGALAYPASFFLVLIVGAALRVQGISELPLIEDSFYTLRDSVTLTDRIRVRPIFFLMQHGLFQFLPVTHVSLRLLPLIFGVLGIWAVWAASNQLFGRSAAMASAVLVAVSPWHIHLSQIGRYWSLVFLEAALLFWALSLAHQNRKLKPLVIATCIAVVGVLTHPTFVFLLPGCVSASMISAGTVGYRLILPKSIWINLLLFILVMVCVIATFAVGLPMIDWSELSPAELMTTARFVPAVIQWVGPVVAVAFFLSIAVLLIPGKDVYARWWGSTAIVSVLIFFAAMLSASLFLEIYAYYVAGLLPLCYITIGNALNRLEKMGDLRTASIVGIMSLLVASVFPGIASNLRDGTRFDYRPMYSHIIENDSRLPVFGTPIAAARYYAPALDFHELTMKPDQLQQSYEIHDAIWVIASYRRYGFLNDVGGGIEHWLWNHCNVVRKDEKVRFDFRRYATVLYRCSNANAPH